MTVFLLTAFRLSGSLSGAHCDDALWQPPACVGHLPAYIRRRCCNSSSAEHAARRALPLRYHIAGRPCCAPTHQTNTLICCLLSGAELHLHCSPPRRLHICCIQVSWTSPKQVSIFPRCDWRFSVAQRDLLFSGGVRAVSATAFPN